jgi:hypothetical protein
MRGGIKIRVALRERDQKIQSIEDGLAVQQTKVEKLFGRTSQSNVRADWSFDWNRLAERTSTAYLRSIAGCRETPLAHLRGIDFQADMDVFQHGICHLRGEECGQEVDFQEMDFDETQRCSADAVT